MHPRTISLISTTSRATCRLVASRAVVVPSRVVLSKSLATTSSAVAQSHNASLAQSTSNDLSIPPNSLVRAQVHPRTHNIPVAMIHFRSPYPERLTWFLHFVMHAAYGLGIPVSQPASLPTQRSLYTVLKSPFVHKKSQENFESKVHKRAIKVWDTNPVVLSQWLKYLEGHMMAGLGMKVIKWERVGYGYGEEMVEEAEGAVRKIPTTVKGKDDMEHSVKAMADEIIKRELKAAGLDSPPSKSPKSKTSP